MTDAERWQRIDDLFDAALDLAPAERARFLEHECGGDGELRAAVERLLAHADTAPGLATGGAFDLVDTLTTPGAGADAGDAEALGPGERVGPWRVVGELGRGGMAVVYEAERAEGGYDQRAALKLVRPGDDRDQLLARFERERQILASLHHPDIARLLDGGTTEDGRPWFAMELVEGEPIDRYCDRRRLGVTERLRLFATVARAVQAAHRALVVHRDLKPSNVLVTGDGRVKLLDFGIAKPLETRVPAAPAGLTQASARVLTPGYASPEQVRGETVTTASDVYQLGVLLYELLTGRRPHDAPDATPMELARAICERPVPPPSSAVTDAAADARGTRARVLRRTLRGDLDHVVAKALAKRPEARYASVAQLVEDVERHLAARPVAARPGGALYRAVKLVRRHAAGFVLAAFAVVLGVALVTFYTLRLADERDRARRLADFLAGVLEVADPWTAGSQELTARQLLDHGAERIDDDLGDDPETAASMLARFASAYAKLGDHERALDLFADALERRRRLLGAEHPDVAALEYEIGRLSLALSRFDEAREHLEHAADVQRRVLGEDHPAHARTLLGLATLEHSYSRRDQAMALGRRALEVLEAAYPADSPQLVDPLRLLALLHHARGEHARGVELRRRVVAIEEDDHGPDHPRVARALGRLGRSLYRAGDFDAAVPLFERALTLFDTAFDEPPSEQGEVLTNYALLLYETGEAARAVELQHHALAIVERFYGPTNPATLMRVHDLGVYLTAAGRPAEAVPHLERSLGALERALGTDSPHLLDPLVSLADAVLAAGDRRRARGLCERAAALVRMAEGQGTPPAPKAVRALAEVYDRMGESAAAEALRRSAAGAA